MSAGRPADRARLQRLLLKIPEISMRRGSLRFTLLAALLALEACEMGSRPPDPKLGQSDEYWNDYRETHPHAGPNADWIGSNKGHR
jgi:hypothetical protein